MNVDSVDRLSICYVHQIGRDKSLFVTYCEMLYNVVDVT